MLTRVDAYMTENRSRARRAAPLFCATYRLVTAGRLATPRAVQVFPLLTRLRQFVVLNYTAVVKIVKKWNRVMGPHGSHLDAIAQLLGHKVRKPPLWRAQDAGLS